MLAKIYSSAVVGLGAVPIEVEIAIASQGLPSFTIVGLPDKAVEEARERVRSAIKNSGADFPAKKITINLAPADLPKEGASFDLPIAIGILVASGQIINPLTDALFIGELSLDGRVRHVNGILSQTILAKEKKLKRIFVPKVNAKEASIIQNIDIFPVTTILELFHHITGTKLIPLEKPTKLNDQCSKEEFEFDMADIKGQERAKRASEIAAAGFHNMLLKGEPGAGKTLLARTLPSILPSLTLDEAIETTKIYSISGMLGNDSIITKRPFRSPHHTTSHIGLIGGGTHPKPGEISLAHRGVLFLDEFPEFPRHVLEALRQPLEDGHVTISRAHGRITFPSKFMLVAASNPCPCGFYMSAPNKCTCSASTIMRYQKRVSGPLLDRIDIHLDVPSVKVEKLTARELENQETSEKIRKRVQKAYSLQVRRFYKSAITANSEMTTRDVKKFCPISNECLQILRMAVSKLNLSARSYYRIIKLSQTIADLEDSKNIQPHHVTEALQYRSVQTGI